VDRVASSPHSTQEDLDTLRSHARAMKSGVWASYAEDVLDAVARIEEQLEAVERVAQAAKTYRDVRGDYTWVQMIQALDAWENPNPAKRPS
jgi:hypothetical protein